MTRDEAEQRYRDEQAHVEALLAQLPPVAREMATRHRRAVELCGRVGPGGSALRLYAEFLADVQSLCDALWDEYNRQPPKAAGYLSQGSGV